MSNLIIQKSSLLSSVLVFNSLDIFFFSSFSMMVTLACLVKSCPVDLKCLSTRMDLSLLAWFLWVFSLKLNIVSHFPTYGLKWHKMHSMRYMTKIDLQLTLWYILNCLPVFLWVNSVVFVICLQHRLFIRLKHGIFLGWIDF